MPAETIEFHLIIPPGIDNYEKNQPAFVFLKPPLHINEITNRITRHIQSMDKTKLIKIEKSLELQLLPASWDGQGNVCFADDPDLRPEFRIVFHAIDLWDYYYALWHSPGYWDSSLGQQRKLPLPHPVHFWKIVKFGENLRTMHSNYQKMDDSEISIHTSKNTMVQPMASRFQVDNSENRTGRFFINKSYYLSHVPNQAWEYNTARIQPLPHWIERHLHQEISNRQIEELIHLISAVYQTCQFQTMFDRFLSNIKPPMNWNST